MSKPDNQYDGCPLIDENQEYSANKKSSLVCFYCNKPYRVTSIAGHFRNYKHALTHQGKDHKKQREYINKYHRKYQASLKKR